MKNTFVLNGLNITIEGNPVSIEHVELTSEMSAQEIATSGGLIKGLISELKPLIQEATKPVVTPAVTTSAINNCSDYNKMVVGTINKICDNKKNYDNNNHNYKNNYKNNNYNKNDKPKDIQKVFSSIQKPECLTEKDSEWKWKAEADSNNRCSICIQNDEFNIVRIHIMSHNCWVHIHKYPSETKIDGCRFDQLPEFMKWSGIPEEMQQYILKVVAL